MLWRQPDTPGEEAARCPFSYRGLPPSLWDTLHALARPRSQAKIPACANECEREKGGRSAGHPNFMRPADELQTYPAKAPPLRPHSRVISWRGTFGDALVLVGRETAVRSARLALRNAAPCREEQASGTGTGGGGEGAASFRTRRGEQGFHYVWVCGVGSAVGAG